MAGNVTGKDRVLLAAQGIKPDKLLFGCGNSGLFITRYYGLTVQEYAHNVARTAELQAQFATEFDFDRIQPVTGYIFYGCGPEMGTKWEWPEENFPEAVDGPVKTWDDLADKFKIPERPTGYFEKYLKMLNEIDKRVGDRVFLTRFFLGPMSIACYMRGLDNYLLDTKIDMDFYHAYMPKCVELAKFLGGHVVSIDATSTISVAVFVTPEIISPSFYHKEIAPYEDEVIRYFAAQGKKVVNSAADTMGTTENPVTQQEYRIIYNAKYGVEGSVEAIEKALKYRPSSKASRICVSGRLLATRTRDELLDFLKKGCDMLVKGHGLYPEIYLRSIAPPTTEDTADMADKLRAIREFRDSYKL